MNILIVESENDEYFVEALIDTMQQSDTDVISIDEFKHASVSLRKLTIQIGAALTTRGVEKIGVILDMDEEEQTDRLQLVNDALKAAFQSEFDKETQTKLTSTDTMFDLKMDEEITIQIACHFTNVGGKGELETVLQAIKTQDSIFADCLLEGWQPCLEKKGKKVVGKGQPGDISHKEILKLWVDFYKRFDTLKKKNRNFNNTDWKGVWTGETQANKKGEIKSVTARGKDIFDLESPRLNDMRNFLALFK